MLFLLISGRSSGVERNLAKVDVVSSNLIARSSHPKERRGHSAAFSFSDLLAITDTPPIRAANIVKDQGHASSKRHPQNRRDQYIR